MDEEYATLLAEFWQPFENGIEIVLATSDHNDTTARTVSAVRVGESIYFATFDNSQKYAVIEKNPNVALCAGATQVKGTARITGGVDRPENQPALAALRAVFADDVAVFSKMPGMVLVEVVPVSGGFGRMKTGGMYAIDFVARTARRLD